MVNAPCVTMRLAFQSCCRYNESVPEASGARIPERDSNGAGHMHMLQLAMQPNISVSAWMEQRQWEEMLQVDRLLFCSSATAKTYGPAL